MGGSVVNILQFALDGVSQQQSAIAGNLANADTPGYTAEDVSFQQSLASALSEGGTASISENSSPAAPASDGNNVDLTTELVAAQESALEYQQITHSLSAQFRLAQGAAGGSFT
ncbi:MAG: flagellar basal body rod protein FlgB [Acidimicrobiales bacterium]